MGQTCKTGQAGRFSLKCRENLLYYRKEVKESLLFTPSLTASFKMIDEMSDVWYTCFTEDYLQGVSE